LRATLADCKIEDGVHDLGGKDSQVIKIIYSVVDTSNYQMNKL